MKLKPLIKTNSRHCPASWIVERFPENYKEMTYVEPFLGGGEVFLNKDRSLEEVLNEPDPGLASVWRAVRDEPQALISKLRKTDYTEKTFLRHAARDNSKDYLQAAVSEFVLRHMSRGGKKKSYLQKDKSKEHFMEQFMGRFKPANERLAGVYVLSKHPVSVLGAFSHENTLVYCDPPPVDEIGEEAHMELGEALKGFKGKVVIAAKNSALYKRLYSEWTRKGVPGRPKDSVWLNF